MNRSSRKRIPSRIWRACSLPGTRGSPSAPSTFTASRVTSFPTPSPGMTAIRAMSVRCAVVGFQERGRYREGVRDARNRGGTGGRRKEGEAFERVRGNPPPRLRGRYCCPRSPTLPTRGRVSASLGTAKESAGEGVHVLGDGAHVRVGEGAVAGRGHGGVGRRVGGGRAGLDDPDDLVDPARAVVQRRAERGAGA